MENDEHFPIMLENIKPEYKKPERRNNFIQEKQYNIIDKTVIKGAKIASNGVVYVEEKSTPKLFHENSSDSQYIIDVLIPKKYKRNIAGTDLIHSSALVGLLDERSQEIRSASKQALQQYARDSLINISDSDQVQHIRRQLDDFSNKELRTLRQKINSKFDEITSSPLKKGYAFHHKNQKSIYTDPEKTLNPNEGVLVNVSTHKDIHRKKIRDEQALEEYKKEINRKK